jgi:hypothetical protein
MTTPRDPDAASEAPQPPSDWKEAVRRWRALPPEEKRRIRWESIPGRVASSMAFSGDPIDEAKLREAHARLPRPGC